MELIGILIIIIGFALKLDTIAVVVSAGIATGLVANMSITEILSTLGEAFITNRTTCLFMLTVPIIGLCERYGLKAKAIMLIKKASNLSTGILLSGYTLIREATIAMGVTLGGHPQFVRPLVSPMAEGAAIAKYGELDEEDLDKIRAYSAASDNIGNFYGQNIFMANAGILLIASTLEGLGMNVDTLQLAKVAIPVGVLAIILWVCQNRLLDRKLKKKYMSRKNNVGGAE
ncbi:DUF969 domain-containing protein [Romboutsia sp. 1001713B170207_170306_H8]|uniref:DUF969 domain-containing protein n=1 Tax=Romboutsia sp. 1001713B170207_170306_H8 TaxID=2787112 RepID=UPI00082209CF|nr:DUF969 domain-containing protein [Romboutsia sp. 1001713B170207_170306_H8]SCH88532.1 Protein of uncharacterised function (DUF969) [uncultured Clostridium sp.]